MDKRERLLAAARDVIYRQGYAATTIAHIAEAADVPLGNVYYYFKTKDAMVEGVIDARMAEVEAALARAETEERPEDRLVAVLEDFCTSAKDVARHGCPFGTLTQELEKRRGRLAQRAARLMQRQLEWMTGQFRAMGQRKKAADLALELLCAMQGATQLTLALRDPRVMRRRFADLAVRIRNQAGVKR